MDRLQGMEVLVKVAHHGSLSGAAERLGMAKSTVSKHITALEERLGVRLLNRSTRQLSLTEMGEIYVERASQILQSIEDTEASLSQFGAVPKGRLRLNAPMTFGQLHLTPVLVRFMRAYPEITVELTLNDRRVDLIDEGYDLAVRIGKLEDSTLLARRIANLPAACVASPAYLERRGVPREPADLKRHNCLRYLYSPTPNEWIFYTNGAEERVRVDGCFSANNGDAITAACVEGLGLAYQPVFTYAEHFQAGRLVCVLQDWQARDVEIHAVYPPQRRVSLKVRALIDFLLKELSMLEHFERAAIASCPPAAGAA